MKYEGQFAIKKKQLKKMYNEGNPDVIFVSSITSSAKISSTFYLFEKKIKFILPNIKHNVSIYKGVNWYNIPIL